MGRPPLVVISAIRFPPSPGITGEQLLLGTGRGREILQDMEQCGCKYGSPRRSGDTVDSIVASLSHPS